MTPPVQAGIDPMTPSPQRCQDEKRRRDEEPPQDAITPMTQETAWSSQMDLHLGA